MSSAETIERLVERANSSTLLEDRRDACRALKAMSKKFRKDVGALGLSSLVPRDCSMLALNDVQLVLTVKVNDIVSCCLPPMSR